MKQQRMMISRKARTVETLNITYEIASNLSSIFDDIYDVTTDPVIALDRGLLSVLDPARDRANDLVRELACHLNPAQDFDPSLDRVRDGVADLAFALTRFLDHSHDNNALCRAVPQLPDVLARDLVLAKRIHNLIVGFNRSSRPAAAVSRAACHVVGFAAGLLPAEYRHAKAEEFACELYDLASTGASRRQQLDHALRTLIRILPLRRALSDARHRVVDRG